jgi:hypothetical protein
MQRRKKKNIIYKEEEKKKIDRGIQLTNADGFYNMFSCIYSLAAVQLLI